VERHGIPHGLVVEGIDIEHGVVVPGLSNIYREVSKCCYLSSSTIGAKRLL
jgi:hypothetical protein